MDLELDGDPKVPICKICSRDVVVTLGDICLICNPPTEKQMDDIATVLVLMTELIKEKRKQNNQRQLLDATE